MTYREIIESLRKSYDENEAQALTRLLGERMFSLSFADIICDGFRNLDKQDEKRLTDAISRLNAGEPVQYILGEETFYGREFRVEKGVLIPRPETEELCRWIINDLASRNNPSDLKPHILDIGTGSGAIAITLALEIPNAKVEAIDISKEALNIANDNAQKLNATVYFHEKDCLDTNTFNGLYDIIVSNPPYVMEKEKADMSRNVLDNEPEQALFVPDNNPLLYYSAISDIAKSHLKPNGALFFEINPLCATQMKDMLTEKGFANIEIRNDQFGKKRMLCATH